MGTPDLSSWVKLLPGLNEVQRRWYAAQKALELGRGGIKTIHELTGISHPTIIKGIKELRSSKQLDPGERLRKPGGGRKKAESHDPFLVDHLIEILEESTAGDPMTVVRWTNKSTRSIAATLRKRGHKVSHATVCRLLHEQGYTLQANSKQLKGKKKSHQDRDGQFRHINDTVKEYQSKGDPVISVDCKKKEKVGNFKNGGRTWEKKGKPKEVFDHDFPSMAEGKAVPYGIYDIDLNAGLVNVGVNYETGEFAVESIRQWWKLIGIDNYPKSKRLLICADSGGSNGYRTRAWKVHLQKFADETGLKITVCHYPPGTSKWNKIEHRMFSFISLNWKGQPLIDYETVVNLIGSTQTAKGLKVDARLDERFYQRRVQYTKQQMAEIVLTPLGDFPTWNYEIAPHS